MATITVQSDQIVHLHLPVLGLPQGARAIRVVTTPMGVAITLVEMTQTIGRRDVLPESLYLRPLAFGDDARGWSTVLLSLSIPWRPPPSESRSLELLATSLVAFGDQDWERAAMDAHAAVDAELKDLCGPLFAVVDFPGRFGLFQRLALVELLCHTRGVSGLATSTRAALRSLDRSRQDAAHGGKRLGPDEIVEPMVGAVATLWWLRGLIPLIVDIRGG